MALFGGNVFSSPVGQRIEQATDASLASENWALNMEICDMINENEDAARDAVKAIRKRLTQNVGKNYTVVMYALIVLETCVKNCGRRFHLLATNKDFVLDLVKFIGPKNDPPTAVQEKVLSLIQSWADAFKGNSEMSGVVQVYQDLKQKGVEFPMTDLDALAPIHTPHRSVPKPEIVHRPPPMTAKSTSVDAIHVPVMFPTSLTPEQLGKMRSEMDIVQENMNVFSEMLTELTPGQEHPSDAQLLKELYKTLKNMQKRVVELVDKVAAEEVTNELLRVNDEMNNLFLRYSRYERNRVGPQGSESPQTQADVHDAKPLIDLDEPLVVSSEEDGREMTAQMAGLGLGLGTVGSPHSSAINPSETAEDEFDMFAQSRKASYETTKHSGSTYLDNSNIDHVPVSLGAAAQMRSNSGSRDEELLDEQLQRETDFDEMEAWLQDKPVNETDELHQNQQDKREPAPQQQRPICTSTEFDRFLAERAVATEQQQQQTLNAAAAHRRQHDKDETENPLFAL